MPTYTQDTRTIAIETPLGKDALLLTAFSGAEECSKLFHYELELLSEKKTINNKDIIGKNVTFSVEFPDGKPRYFNGHVQRFAYGGSDDRLSTYRATIVPWFWFLTRTSDCRIFQDKTIPEIIQEVVTDAGFSSDLDISGLGGSHKKWEYCVQYRETDFHFLSRLMELEGIFYFFKHEKGKHKLVLGDAASAYAMSADSQVQFLSNLSQPEESDQIKAWEHQYEFKSGKWAHTDYNFETPTTSLLAQTSSTLGLPTADKFEFFDFPGEYEKKSDGTDDVKLRMEEEEAGYNVVQGQSICRGFSPGHKFTLAKHHNPAEQGKGYVVTSIRHQARLGSAYVAGGAGGGDSYRNSFTCIPDAVTLRPPRVTQKPRIHGVQTAVVVGPDGDEIYCDEFGRVKVQFHWDRLGKKDDKSSCWIRCTQANAGKGWGSMMIPRIGQEVVVTYLEGDPDRPLITGVVYNASQMPAYTLPDEKTKSSLKSNSTPGGEGFNEIRFEDGADKEQFFIHAQKDMDIRVLNDQREIVKGKKHLIVGGEVGDQYEKIEQDRHLTVKGKRQELIEGDDLSKVKGNQHLVVDLNRNEKVGQNVNVTVGQSRNEKIGMTQSLDCGQDIQAKAGLKVAIEGGMEVHIKAGMKLILEAGLQLSLKCGANFIDLGPSGVAINGLPLCNINSGGAAGAGSGCSPTAPAAAEVAVPTEPEEADDTAVSGSKSAP